MQRVFVELIEIGLRGPFVAILDVARFESVEDAGISPIIENAVVKRLDVDCGLACGSSDGQPVDVAAQVACRDHDVGKTERRVVPDKVSQQRRRAIDDGEYFPARLDVHGCGWVNGSA